VSSEARSGHHIGQWGRAAAALHRRGYGLWREHSDAINLALIARWLDRSADGRALKTDLFDEAVGRGLCADTRWRLPRLLGMDLSVDVVRRAALGTPGLRGAAADVRELPFADGAFETVLSISTLDHFESTAEITHSLREIRRVLRPGGLLLLTLDNPANPKIRLRNALPWSLLRRTGLVPYFIGRSVGPGRLRRELMSAGFTVLEVGAIVHCPRVLAVAASRLGVFAKPRARRRLLGVLRRFEVLERWPTRFLTAHFTAVLARWDP
jgi:SAM-dependent methyltransferase